MTSYCIVSGNTHHSPTAPPHRILRGQDSRKIKCRGWAGQSNDAIFQQARAGRLTCKVESVAAVEEQHVVLGNGERLRADLIVAAYGLKYQAEPAFLKELGIGELPFTLFQAMSYCQLYAWKLPASLDMLYDRRDSLRLLAAQGNLGIEHQLCPTSPCFQF